QVEIEIHVISGESCIDLNRLFAYVKPIEEGDDDPGEDAGGGDPDPETDGDDDDEEDGESDKPVNGDPFIYEEFDHPPVEVAEAARRMLARLIEALIDSNLEAGFDYEARPSPDTAADSIVDWVLDRKADERTRRIYDISNLKRLPGISWELFNGPKDPAEGDEEEQGEPLEDYDPSGLGFEGFIDVEGGVEELPTPLGLRHVLTAYSTGKPKEAWLNINTARPEVLMAVLVEHFDDYDEAQEVALEINAYLDSYVGDEEGEDEDGDGGSSDEEDDELDLLGANFNCFESLDDLNKVNEEWAENAGDEDGVIFRLREALKPIAVFHSTYFTAQLKGERDGHKIEGEAVLQRDTDKVRFLLWREISS
ncbi:MAG: hypothetical protein V3T77_09840, partial [Planctomycetota bacterium]